MRSVTAYLPKHQLKADFGSVTNGSRSPSSVQHTQLQIRSRALELCEEREAFTQVLRESHCATDLDHMVSQHNGEETASRILAPVQHILEERGQIAYDLLEPATRSVHTNIVDFTTRLCSLCEGKDRRCNSHE